MSFISLFFLLGVLHEVGAFELFRDWMENLRTGKKFIPRSKWSRQLRAIKKAKRRMK